jgi:hypothetical protein
LTKLLLCRDCGCPTRESRTYCPDCRETRIGSLVRHLHGDPPEASFALGAAAHRLREAYRPRSIGHDQDYWPNNN